MTRISKGFAVGAIALTMMAAAADAATMQAVFTGTISRSYDHSGMFGPARSSLNGQNYTMTFVYDTALGTRTTAPGKDALTGGTDYGVTPDPTVSATIAVGGHSYSITGSTHSQYSVGQVLNSNAQQYYALASNSAMLPDGSNFDYQMIFGLYGSNGFLPSDNLETPFSLSYAPYVFTAAFNFITYDAATNTNGLFTYGFLTLDNLTVSPVSVAAVPLPASGLLLAGAGLALAGLRRRRAG